MFTDHLACLDKAEQAVVLKKFWSGYRVAV